MIHRIHPNVHEFQMVYLDDDVVEEAMGEDCLIHFDPRPKKYAESWVPFKVEFYDAITESGESKKPIPDIIADNNGKLFVSAKAYEKIYCELGQCGEWLPITYHDNDRGFLLNVLTLAEQFDAVDKENTEHDHNGLHHVAFYEEHLTGVTLFRTKEDGYLGIYCTEKTKNFLEKKGMKGCKVVADLSNRPM